MARTIPGLARLPRPRSRLGWTGAALVVLAVALLVLGVLQWRSVRSHSELQGRREAAVRAASAEMTTLLSLSTATAKQDLARLQAGATAGFRDQLQTQANYFLTTISQGQVSLTGKVAAAALVSMNDSRDKATVAVAASAGVKNKSSSKTDTRSFRASIAVQRVKGRWLVSGFAFVT